MFPSSLRRYPTQPLPHTPRHTMQPLLPWQSVQIRLTQNSQRPVSVFLPSAGCLHMDFVFVLSLLYKDRFLYYLSALILSLVLDLCSLQYYLYFHYTYLLWHVHVQVRRQLVGFLLPCRSPDLVKPSDLEENTFIC